MPTPKYSQLAKQWSLDNSITFLNHGSFGARPIPIQEKQMKYRKQLEAEPLRFLTKEADENRLVSKIRDVMKNDFELASHGLY